MSWADKHEMIYILLQENSTHKIWLQFYNVLYGAYNRRSQRRIYSGVVSGGRHTTGQRAFLMLFCCYGNNSKARVGNGYDQAQLRSIKMADAEHAEFRLSRIVSTQHLVRRPYCAWRESWDRLNFRMRETAATGSDIADIGRRKYQRIDRNCHTRK